MEIQGQLRDLFIIYWNISIKNILNNLMAPVLPVQVVVSMHQLRGSESGELGPVDVVVLDPLLAEADHLEPDVLSLSITVQPQTEVLGLAGQLLATNNV